MKRYLNLLNILLLTGVIFFTVKAFYTLVTANVDSGRRVKVASRQLVPHENETRHPLSYYSAIGGRNLFKTEKGTGGRGGKPEKLDIENLEPTDLKLDLLGTITGDQREAYAVIEDTATKQQNLFRIGDTVQNAIVKMILREKVVLNVNGKDEILKIQKDRQGPTSFNTQATAFRPEGSQNISVKRSQMESAIRNVNTLMKQIRIRPNFRNGKPDGLRLTGIRPNSIFYNMGLKSGDILMGANGKPIESVEDVFKLYQNLQSSSKVQLEIKRRGRPKTIDYHIE
ncbi:MAG: type II secretion system protein GspC [Desulfobacterales bacterium]